MSSFSCALLSFKTVRPNWPKSIFSYLDFNNLLYGGPLIFEGPRFESFGNPACSTTGIFLGIPTVNSSTLNKIPIPIPNGTETL